MANINKFSPVSPDTFLKAEKDMALAKFGHLNAIVDAYNTLDTAVTAVSPSAGALKANTITESTSGTGVTITGQLQPTPILATSATTLTAAQSGSLIKLDLATGFVVTLPTAKAGLRYEFLIGTSITSGNYTIQASAATELFTGASYTIATTNNSFAPGASDYKLIMDSTTKGGLRGGRIRVTCYSATNWVVEAMLIGSGTAATPFST